MDKALKKKEETKVRVHTSPLQRLDPLQRRRLLAIISIEIYLWKILRRWMENPVLPSSCVTPAGTSIEVQNEWEENTHTNGRRNP